MGGAYIWFLVLVHIRVWHLLGSTHQDALEIALERAERVCATKTVSREQNWPREGARG